MMAPGTPAALDVVCLRPEGDFLEVGVVPPAELTVSYIHDDRVPEDAWNTARALVLPSVGPPLPSSWLDARALQLVQFTGAGFDRLGDLDRLPAGIIVANVPAVNAREVAEYVLFAAGAVLRGLALADREVREGRYGAIRARLKPSSVRSLHSRTVGVVGMGNIGLAVARLMVAAGAQVRYTDPVPARRAAADELGLTGLELDELLSVCDIVSLHVPLTPATRGLLDEARIRLMRPGAILINAARGGVVDEEALARALEDGHVAGAAVDVYEQEPPGSACPLLNLSASAAQRVLLTPHIAGVAYEAASGLYAEAWANVHRTLVEGSPPMHQVWPRDALR